VPAPKNPILPEEEKMDHKDIDRLKELFDELGFLPYINESVMTELGRIFTKGKFKKGEFIIKKDEQGDTFFIVSKGEAEAFVGDENEEIQAAHTVGEGNFFGEIALITDGPRTAWVVALCDVEAFLIRKEDLQRLLMSIPEIAEKIRSTAKERLFY
jgi:CRP-like cAMP-binding protein